MPTPLPLLGGAETRTFRSSLTTRGRARPWSCHTPRKIPSQPAQLAGLGGVTRRPVLSTSIRVAQRAEPWRSGERVPLRPKNRPESRRGQDEQRAIKSEAGVGFNHQGQGP